MVTHPIPPGDPLLADALASLGVSAKGRRAGSPRVRAWVRRAARRQEEEWLARLIERGALRAETRRFLGFVPYHRFPAGQAERSTEVRQRFDAALHAGLPTPRERKLAALVAAAGGDVAAVSELGPAVRAQVVAAAGARGVDGAGGLPQRAGGPGEPVRRGRLSRSGCAAREAAC
ncbi:hypothetical protein GCM10020000_44370 [Streptomyces olivoverticillatus]